MDSVRMGELLPHYEIGGLLGSGSFARVYEGTHRTLGRRVAIKQLSPDLAADPEVRQRFLDEAQTLAKFDHPHIVRVYDFAEAEDGCLLVMEHLGGGALAERWRTTGVPAAEAVALAIACCEGLEYAHRNQVLHRDVKPDNVLFSEGGELRVADFGIAKILDGTKRTQTGMVMGTPHYMSPEQGLGQPLTPATDVYAVATMLYEFLSGFLPFRSDTSAVAMLVERAQNDPAPLSRTAPDVPGPVADVIMAGLARDPNDRIRSAEEFAYRLAEAVAEGFGPPWMDQAITQPHCSGRVAAALARSSGQYSSPSSRATPPPPPPPPPLVETSTGEPTVLASVAGAAPAAGEQGGQKWDLASFRAKAAESCSPASQSFIERLIEHGLEHGHHPFFGAGATPGISWYYDLGSPVSVWALYLDARGPMVRVSFSAIAKLSARRAGVMLDQLSENPGLRTALAAVSRRDLHSKLPKIPVDGVLTDQDAQDTFFAALDHLLTYRKRPS